MRAWAEPVVSPAATAALGPAPALRLHDTRSGTVRALRSNAGPARMYACGITPYDATHLGHASTYLAFDLVVRAWRAAGRDVTYVQNVTDVDDPLLVRARETGEDWRALADREIQLYREDMESLRVIPPDHLVGAVEAIPLIVDMIEVLRDRGAVYAVNDDLYFEVHDDPDFGSVSSYDVATMQALSAERGGDPDRTGKRDPLDCLVWQGARPDEPSWPSRLGAGRPGWHVECAAIAEHYLGTSYDVNGGGSDLIFPHHEMSASELQVAWPGQPFADAYVHAGLVAYAGHKMSKSLGNLVLVSRLRESGVDPRVIRVALLGQHYRSDWEWTDDLLQAAKTRLDTWSTAAQDSAPGAIAAAHTVRAALAEDLDAPAALRALDAWAAGRGTADDPAAVDVLLSTVDASLGVQVDR